jgi:hypothetical protein
MVDIKKKLEELRKKKGKVYSPLKYFKGLKTEKEVEQRYNRILKGSKTNTNDPKAYRPFKTDKGKKVRKSKHTVRFDEKFPDAKSLANKSKVTGVPLSIIKEVYNKGLAAWRTGHRPGASQQAWGYARVHSFLMRGPTYYTADSYLVKEAKKKMTPSNRRRWETR